MMRDRDVPAALDQINERLASTAKDLGDASVELPAASFGPADFVDQGHFSIQGARRFAEALMPTVRDVCH